MGENRELWALWVSFVDAIVVEMLVEKRGALPSCWPQVKTRASLQQNKPCFAKPQPEEQLGGILRSTGVGLLFIIYLTLLI